MKTNSKNEKIRRINNPSIPKIKLNYAEDVNNFAEEIFNTVREPLLLLDEELRIAKASRSFYDFFKVTSDETIGNLVYDLGNRQWNIPKLRELLETIIPEKTTFDNYEVEHIFSKIGKRVMLLNARKIPRGFWEEQMILLAIEDITERKHKEESLSEKSRLTEEYLDILLNHAHVPIIIWDSTSVIKRFNHEFEKLSGYNWTEIEGKNIDILFPKDKINSTLELIKNTLRENKLEIYEVDILTKDKKIKTVIWNSANILDKEGKNIVATIAQDITKRKKSEELLRESEEKYHSFFENSMDATLLTIPNGKILSANPAACKMFGYSEEEFAELDVSSFVDAADSKSSVLLSERELNGNTRGEITLIRKDGTYFPAEISSAIFRNHEGLNLGRACMIIRDITERKRAEGMLTVLETRYRRLFESAKDGILILDAETGKIIDVNPFLIELLGYSHEKFVEKAIWEIGLFKDIAANENKFFELQQKEYVRYDNLPLETADRQKINVEFVSNVYLVNSHKVIQCNIRDITKRKKAEEALEENEKRYRELFDNAPVGYHELDIHGRIIRINRTELNMLGYTEEEMMGQYIWEFVSDEDRSHERVLEKLNGSLHPAKGKELYYRRKDLTIFPILVEELLLRDSSENIIGIRTTIQDITERKRTEEEIIMLSQSLKSINECVSITDKEDKILFVNSSFLKTYGYDDDELIGKQMSIVRSANNLSEVESEILPATLHGGWSGELLNKRKDGSEFPVYLSTTIINDKENKPLVLIGVASDITERKRAEKELIEAKVKAEESDKLKSEFLAQMSHEIRTPLSAIIGNVDFLHESFGEDIDPEARSCFYGIDQASKRIIRTVDLILNAAELKTNGYQPHFVKINLDSEILKILCQEHQRLAKQKDLELIYVCEITGANILADEYSITQIFANLINNAIKYTKKGTVEVVLKRNISGNIIVEVKDPGVGISKEFISRLFEPFTQEEQGYTRSFDGNGLGLALVKNYCDINKLQIEVESIKNTGSTFRIIFQKTLNEV